MGFDGSGLAQSWDRLGSCTEAPPEGGHRGAVSGSALLNVGFIYLCTMFNSLFILHVSVDLMLGSRQSCAYPQGCKGSD